jgi:hypothetical protein
MSGDDGDSNEIRCVAAQLSYNTLVHLAHLRGMSSAFCGQWGQIGNQSIELKPKVLLEKTLKSCFLFPAQPGEVLRACIA